MRPQVFIASSTENLRVVHAIRDGIGASDRLDVEAVAWDGGTFEPSLHFIESLEKALDNSAYAVIVLSPNDFEKVRGKKYRVPRDNALLELGLFIGRRGRDHCYIVHVSDDGRKPPFKLPSDIGGIKPIVYSEHNADEFVRTIDSACDQILQTIEKREHEKQQKFCARIAGAWWEIITVDHSKELSYFTIVADASYSTVRMGGDHFGRVDGDMTHIGHWDTTAVGLHEQDRKVTYCWSGHHPHADGYDSASDVEGYGWLKFRRSDGALRDGYGAFLDLDPDRMTTARWKDVVLVRANDSQAHTMTEKRWPDRLALADDVLTEHGFGHPG